MNCPVFWMSGLISSRHGYITWSRYVTAARNLLRGHEASAEAPFEVCCIKKVISLTKMQAKVEKECLNIEDLVSFWLTGFFFCQFSVPCLLKKSWNVSKFTIVFVASVHLFMIVAPFIAFLCFFLLDLFAMLTIPLMKKTKPKSKQCLNI